MRVAQKSLLLGGSWLYSPTGSASRFLTKDGCPISRSFFARCGITRVLNLSASVNPESEENMSVSQHLAKNERDVGHPSFVRKREADPCRTACVSEIQGTRFG